MDIHEETLKIARNLIEKDPSLTDWVISKFPELAESEDERIRKWLIKDMGRRLSCWTSTEVTKEQVLAWLEKQGEQHTLQTDEQKLVPKFKIGDKIKLKSEPSYPFREIVDIKNDAYYFDREIHLPFKRQDEWESEEKPAKWSEEDEKMRAAIIFTLAGFIGNEDKIDWLKSLRPQNKQEWSDKDKTMAFTLMRDVEQMSYISIEGKNERIGWLNKLPDNIRPRSHWKPSDEQMKALSSMFSIGDEHTTQIVASLYNDLKKL